MFLIHRRKQVWAKRKEKEALVINKTSKIPKLGLWYTWVDGGFPPSASSPPYGLVSDSMGYGLLAGPDLSEGSRSFPVPPKSVRCCYPLMALKELSGLGISRQKLA